MWFEIRKRDTSDFVLSVTVAVCVFSDSTAALRIVSSVSMKNPLGVLMDIVLNLYMALGGQTFKQY